MKKVLNIILCGIFLSAIEYCILLICLQAEGVIQHTTSLANFSRAFRHTNEIIAVRFIFYFVFWVLTNYLLYDKIKLKRVALKLALYNCSFYVFFSAIMSIVFSASVFFRYSFFYFLVIATLLSPFILSIVPRAKQLINKI